MTSSHNPPGGPKYVHLSVNPPSLTSRRYIQDFSKALAGEVKILLSEVGKLRDEKRALQLWAYAAEIRTLWLLTTTPTARSRS